MDRFCDLSFTDNGRLIIRGNEIKPRAVDYKRVKDDTQTLVNELIKTGLIKKK